MKHIRIIVLSIAAALVVACCAFLTVMNKEIGIPEKTYEEDPQLTALTPYGQKLGKVATYSDALWDQNWEKIANSDAGYLQNPDVEVTIDNLQQCFYDFLSAPIRLYFFNSNLSEEPYKCGAPEISVYFAEALDDVVLKEGTQKDYASLVDERDNAISSHTDPAVKEIYFHNLTGYVMVLCYQNCSYIMFSRYIEKTDTYAPDAYFYADQDLTGRMDAICMKIMPYSMEIAPMELE